MTPEQHAAYIGQLEFQLHKADYGLGMPRDYSEVLRLTLMLAEARRQAARDAIASAITMIDSDYDYDEQQGGY